MAWNLTDTESQLVFHFFSLTCVGSLIFNLFYLWTTVDCFSVQCLVSSQIQKCVDCWNLHLNPLQIQTVVCCWNFLLFIILSFLIQEYLRFSWSCLFSAELFVNGEIVQRSPERQRRVEPVPQRAQDRPRYSDRTRYVKRRENQSYQRWCCHLWR